MPDRPGASPCADVPDALRALVEQPRALRSCPGRPTADRSAPTALDHRDTDSLEPKRLHGLANVDCHPVRLPAVAEPGGQEGLAELGGMRRQQRPARRLARVDGVLEEARKQELEPLLRQPRERERRSSMRGLAAASESTSSGWDGSSMERS